MLPNIDLYLSRSVVRRICDIIFKQLSKAKKLNEALATNFNLERIKSTLVEVSKLIHVFIYKYINNTKRQGAKASFPYFHI